MEKIGLNLVIHVLEGKINQKILAMFSWKMTLITYWICFWQKKLLLKHEVEI